MAYGWVLWWNGRQIAHITSVKERGVRVHLDARKMWETKDVWAASINQAKRYAERWCAARLYPDLPLRQAVARLTDGSPIQQSPPLPGLPPTREQQQQSRRLAEAGAKEVERIKIALEPRKAAEVTKRRAKDPIVRGRRACVHELVCIERGRAEDRTLPDFLAGHLPSFSTRLRGALYSCGSWTTGVQDVEV
ncbi:hypothetical protein QEG52_000639 [Stenotrophomonas maltophilia]